MAQSLLDRLRRILEDVNIAKTTNQDEWLPTKFAYLIFQPQHGIPDLFIWLISGNKRLAYQRIPARNILFSMQEEEKGKDCGSLQTLFLKVPA